MKNAHANLMIGFARITPLETIHDQTVVNILRDRKERFGESWRVGVR